MITQNYNPDVLTCLANLSNDEVFTPPAVVNKMLDLLPTELWSNPDAKFLDPVSKTGVFLREIAKRLMAGLEEQIPDVQERANHIFGTQLYGLAITELTALMSRRSVYCSKFANGEYSICTAFDDEQGNIRYEPTAHSWQGGRCIYCGASQEVYDRGEALESHAYKFIHTDNPKKLFPDMKFDVIIGNPPYQLSDGGAQASATPIYHKFVQQAKLLKPHYLIMIIPSRWMTGGRGLDDFRKEMLSDKHITHLIDYFDAKECFNGVEIKGGVCYFLRDNLQTSTCKVLTHPGGDVVVSSERYLLEDNDDVFIRDSRMIPIKNKVQGFKEPSFDSIVSSMKPYGLRGDFFLNPRKYNLPEICDTNPGRYISILGLNAKQQRIYKYVPTNYPFPKNAGLNDYKIFIPRNYGSGKLEDMQFKAVEATPNMACTETFVQISPFADEQSMKNCHTYIKTKFFRFLVGLRKHDQGAGKDVYKFVPIQDFSQSWTDEKLYAKYGLTDEEINFIESMIRPME